MMMMVQIELAPVNLPFLSFSMTTCGLNTTKQLNVIVITALATDSYVYIYVRVWVNEWMKLHSEMYAYACIRTSITAALK